MQRQKEWDKYEAAILLDAYLKILISKSSYSKIVEETSNKLRSMAMNKGLVIDDIYRNKNGIMLQLRSMESAYLGYKKTLPATKLFTDIVRVYRENNKEYDKWLTEANIMAKSQLSDKKSQFKTWILKKTSSKSLPDVDAIVKTVEEFCISRKIINKPLMEVTDTKKLKEVLQCVESNRAFRFQNKNNLSKIASIIRYYYKFIKDMTSDVADQTENSKALIKMIRYSDGESSQISEKISEICTINFLHLESISHTKPLSLIYFGDEYEDLKSWTDLYVKFIKLLYDDYPHKFMLNKSLTGAGRVDLTDENGVSLMVEPKRIKEGIYLETNLSTNNIIKKIKNSLELCLVDFENVIIKYEGKKSPAQNEDNANISTQKSKSRRVENDKLEPYQIVLKEAFPKGFRLDSSIEVKRFKKYWKELNGDDIELEDEKIEKLIKKCGVIYEGRVYAPSIMISEGVKEKLLSYINSSFEIGNDALFYEALFNKFSDDFLECRIYDAKMLREYLQFVNDGQYHVGKKFISKDASVKVDSTEEIKQCLIEAGIPIKYEEIYKKLPNIAPQKIRQIITLNPEFINNGRNQCFHIGIVALSEIDIDNISSLIEEAINDKKFISGNELASAISAKYPQIIENNNSISSVGLRKVIAYKLKNKFAFEGNIISNLNEQFSMMDVFAEFCKTRHSFSLEELRILKHELGTVIYFDAVYKNSLRISQTQFVSKEQASFNVEMTDLAIRRFCKGEYIPLTKVSSFSSFPDAGFPWNIYMLEHYVATYSQDYKLVHTNYNEKACAGGIVKRSSEIDTFDDLIIDALANSHIELTKESALQFLCNEGYLARRNYSGIEGVLIKAKEQRNQKGI